MAKRGKKARKTSPKRSKEMQLLVENNVKLQGVLADVSVELKSLTKEITKLLGVFQEAGKTFGEEKAVEDVEEEKQRDLIPKLDNLIDQNKAIAKALILLESTIKEKGRTRDLGF